MYNFKKNIIMKQTVRIISLFVLIICIKQSVFSQYSTQTYMDVNNIRALIDNTGNHFSNASKAQYVVPKEGAASTLFANSLWVGGKDIAGNLKLAAVCYRQKGVDFWPGPLSTRTASTDLTTVNEWNRFFVVSKQDLLYFANPNRDPSDIPTSILEWPAHGDTSKRQALYLAPFHDIDGDGIYNPYKGDYPMIKGDIAIFFIFNDNYASHTESGGAPIGLEVHAMVYAFAAPDDDVLDNTIFMNYKLYNRSSFTLLDTYVGLWTDFDIGYAADDYIGCDVGRSTYFGYNGTAVDGTGLNTHYGNNPPLQAVTILGGPYLDADGYDNPSFKGNNVDGPSFAYNYSNVCEIVTQHGNVIPFTWNNNITENVMVRSEAINGMNFGDGIMDNERYGMRKFVYHNNDYSPSGAPSIAVDYYNYLRGIWIDNSKMRYGGTGFHPGDNSRPECDFMFPGMSDPCNWGTKGVVPFNKDWTEENEGNAPADRRGLASMGPFTFESGAMHELDFAFVTIFPKDTLSAIERYGEQVDSIRTAFFRGTTSSGQDFNTTVEITLGINENNIKDKAINIYPTPAQHTLYIMSAEEVEQVSIYDISGRELVQLPYPAQSIDISHLANGIYIIKVKTAAEETVKKLTVNN